jgi:tRNA-dihydrouridine synthase B
MYTGQADHGLTAELVERVDVPVMASGDITSRERAEEVLDTAGAAGVMIGRGAQGNPWFLRELTDGEPQSPTRAEVVAELIRFVREVAREMGPDRSVGWLRKFYGWYLHGGLLPKPIKAAVATAPTLDEVERVLLENTPGAEALLEDVDRELAGLRPIEDDELLDLPISIYAGG